MKMLRKNIREGALLRIDLADGKDAFARVLPNSQVAFYNFFMNHEAPVSTQTIYESSILFATGVMKSAFQSNSWKSIDYQPLEDELLRPREYYIKDVITGRYSKYKSSDGSRVESTPEECRGLERASVWSVEQIEDRLRDHHAGRPNRWLYD